MEKTIYLILSVLLLTSCTPNAKVASNSFTISGELTGADQTLFYLQKYDDGKFLIVDSAVAVGEKFSFDGKITLPERYYLSKKGEEMKKAFFLSPTDITLSGNAEELLEVTVSGSPLEDEYVAFEESLGQFNDRQQESITAYWAADSAGDAAAKEAAVAEMDVIREDQKGFVKAYVLSHTKSPVSTYLAYSNLSFESDHKELAEILGAFDPGLQESPYYQMMAERAAKLSLVAIGKPAPAFTQTTPAGDELSLASFKGKYLLIDFWASWCGPCRRENPNVVAMYAEMQDKNFDILGVSLDSDREKWLQAIEDDQLTWSQVSDLGSWQNKVAQLYAVNAIPHTILLDPEGTIIAKDLSTEELKDKLNELLAAVAP